MKFDLDPSLGPHTQSSLLCGSSVFGGSLHGSLSMATKQDGFLNLSFAIPQSPNLEARKVCLDLVKGGGLGHAMLRRLKSRLKFKDQRTPFRAWGSGLKRASRHATEGKEQLKVKIESTQLTARLHCADRVLTPNPLGTWKE